MRRFTTFSRRFVVLVLWTHCFTLCQLLALVLINVAAIQAAEPAGVVVRKTGKVQLIRQEKPVEVRLYGMVYPDDQLVASEDASVTVAFTSNGRMETWKSGRTTVATEGFQPGGEAKANRQTREQRLIDSAVSRLPADTLGGTVVLRSSPERDAAQRAVRSPIDGSVITDRQPLLKWASDEASAEFEVVLTTVGTTRPMWKATSKSPQISYDGDALAPAQTYEWTVLRPIGAFDAETVAKGTFTVATPAQSQLAGHLDFLVKHDDVAFLSVAALQFAQQGMTGHATAVYQRIVELEPDNGEFVLMLAEMHRRANNDAAHKAAIHRARQLGVVIEDE